FIDVQAPPWWWSLSLPDALPISVGDAQDCADMIHEFLPIARAIIGLNDLKIISFGPRPLNFLACNAPIRQLYNLGVEIEENSELDLFEAFHRHDRSEERRVGKESRV